MKSSITIISKRAESALKYLATQTQGKPIGPTASGLFDTAAAAATRALLEHGRILVR